MTVTLHKLPYPYSAMLAICSDLDETPDANTYFEICAYLNTTRQTAIGRGLGLEVGNTLYFSMPEDQFAYLNASDQDRDRLHQLIKSGHIDCLHSFGDHVSTREEVKRCWQYLNDNDAGIEVWIDHAQAPSNFDDDIMEGQGALTDAACYHADLSLAQGIRFVWKGRVTSVIAKQVPPSLQGLFSPSHPIASTKTVLKELAKICLAYLGSTKYQMHKSASLIRSTPLKSGQLVTEFIRSNPSWGGVSHSETADGIADVLTRRVLDTLVEKNGTSIFYTHLGKTRSTEIFPAATRAAFELLAQYAEQKKILVATTRRVLGYCDTLSRIRWHSEATENEIDIVIEDNLPAVDLAGITWCVPASTAVARVKDQHGLELPSVIHHDASGQCHVSLPWHPLTYPTG